MSALLAAVCGAVEEDGWATCQVFGVTTDPTGLILSFSNASAARAISGVLHFDTQNNAVDWRIDGLRFQEGHDLRETCLTEDNGEPLCRLRMPHAAKWSPDGDLVIADTLNNRVLLVRPPDPGAGEGSGNGVGDVISVLDASNDGWGPARWPNNVQVISRDHEVYLLLTYKGSDATQTGHSHAGRIMLWEISDPDEPEQVWAFPEDGYLAAVHHALIKRQNGTMIMLYAHSFGASSTYDGELGSVGIAKASLNKAPTYIGDVITSTDEALGFVRSAEIIDDGAMLLVTDSGCERPDEDCTRPSRVMKLGLDIPESEGLSGAFSGEHDQQRFVVLPMIGHTIGDGLRYPFEAELMAQPRAPQMQ